MTRRNGRRTHAQILPSSLKPYTATCRWRLGPRLGGADLGNDNVCVEIRVAVHLYAAHAARAAGSWCSHGGGGTGAVTIQVPLYSGTAFEHSVYRKTARRPSACPPAGATLGVLSASCERGPELHPTRRPTGWSVRAAKAVGRTVQQEPYKSAHSELGNDRLTCSCLIERIEEIQYTVSSVKV